MTDNIIYFILYGERGIEWSPLETNDIYKRYENGFISKYWYKYISDPKKIDKLFNETKSS